MTVPTTINREQYATDGVTTAFTIHFPFFDDTDVNAIFVDSGGSSTALALSTDFTVTGGNGAGGTLTTTGILATGGTLTLFRDIPFTQEDDYVENDPLPADTLEGGFDRAAMRDQQLKDATDRALTLPVTTPSGVSAELPTPAANQYLGWDASGTGLENKNLPTGTAVYSSIATTKAGATASEAVTPDGLAAIWQEGGALTAAASVPKPGDTSLGGSYTVSGNTGTNTFWAGDKDGDKMWHRYTGTPLLGTSGNLVPPGGAAYQLIAGDMILWRWDASATKWRAYAGMRADGTALVVATTDGYATYGASHNPTALEAGKEIEFTGAGGYTCVIPSTQKNPIKNSTTGEITVSMSSGDLDGLASRNLRPGDRVVIQGTGSAGSTISGEYSYDSGDQTITTAGALTLAHGLGVRPTRFEAEMVCVTTEAGYTGGTDRVPVSLGGYINGGSNTWAMTPDATNLNLRYGSSVPALPNKGTGVIGNLTAANWKLRLRVYAK